jgi:hypothetical protein
LRRKPVATTGFTLFQSSRTKKTTDAARCEGWLTQRSLLHVCMKCSRMD